MNSKNNKALSLTSLPRHIKKGHQLVFSRQDLSPREADLFGLMIATMTPSDWNNGVPRYEFTASQLGDWFNLDTKHVATVIDPAAKRLTNKSIGVQKVDNKNVLTGFRYIPLFKMIEYENGVLKMIPNDLLKSEYIEYNQGFALINTKNFMTLDTEYSKRLYEILSRFKDKNFKRKYDVDELKGLFGILDESGNLKKNKKSLGDISMFLNRCIKNSIKRIAKNPETNKEIIFDEGKNGNLGYNTIKNKRKIIGIEFLYRWVTPSKKIKDTELDLAIKTIRELGINRKNSDLSEEECNELINAFIIIGEPELAKEVKDSNYKKKLEPNKEIAKLLSELKKTKCI